MPLAFSAMVFLASAAIVAYLTNWFGVAIAPFAVLAAATLSAASALVWLRRSLRIEREESIAAAMIVAAILGWLLWLAWPSLLPLGSGPDLTHHLALIDFIERQWQLPRDPQLAAVLGEMVSYTPGLHLLAALTGAWTRTDGLHTVYSIVAVTVAIKAGLVFLIARRLMPDRVPRTPLALTAVLLLFGPRDYFIGSFTEASYLPQVVSEMFAAATWLAVVMWSEQPSAAASAMIALFGAATFLTWPVAVGPVCLLAAAVIACRLDYPLARRARDLMVATIPIASAAALHAFGRTNAMVIVGGAGYVVYPQIALFGWWFLAPAAVGVIAAAFDRRSRTCPVLLAAIALQSAALLVVANRAGADRPYMALKMVYLAIYPLAVAGALAFARVFALVWRAGPTHRSAASRDAAAPGSALGRRLSRPTIAASGLVAALAFPALQSAIKLPRAKPAVSQPLFLAGRWARTNLKPECVDYVVNNVYSAYWLHIAVLRNARAAPRSTDDDTYQPERERVRWVEPNGLPYAIAQDFDGLPRDVRANVDVVARFDHAAIIKRRGAASCGG